MRPSRIVPFVLAACLFAGPASAGSIEAVKGKRYTLTKRHGPWMILVASFQDVPEKRTDVVDGRGVWVRNHDYREGSRAIDAADHLVYELRRYGIPAYVFVQGESFERAATVDRQQRLRNRAYRAQQRNIAVVAGNYRSASTDTAQKTLALVKRFQPKFLTGGDYTTRTATGAVFHPTPGQPTPLSGAFLTTNPLLTAEEARRMAGQRDPLLLKLNSGIDHCLLKNKGRYTVLVASFHGNSSTFAYNQQADVSRLGKASNSLDTAAASAQQMCRYMRSRRTDAYVLHERYRSIVTVGAFDSPNDPRIAKLIRFFGPKPIVDPKTGAKRMHYERLTIPKAARDGSDIHLPIDPQPRVIEVPRF